MWNSTMGCCSYMHTVLDKKEDITYMMLHGDRSGGSFIVINNNNFKELLTSLNKSGATLCAMDDDYTIYFPNSKCPFSRKNPLFKEFISGDLPEIVSYSYMTNKINRGKLLSLNVLTWSEEDFPIYKSISGGYLEIKNEKTAQIVAKAFGNTAFIKLQAVDKFLQEYELDIKQYLLGAYSSGMKTFIDSGQFSLCTEVGKVTPSWPSLGYTSLRDFANKVKMPGIVYYTLVDYVSSTTLMMTNMSHGSGYFNVMVQWEGVTLPKYVTVHTSYFKKKKVVEPVLETKVVKKAKQAEKTKGMK